MAGPRIPAVGARLRAWRGSLNGGVILMALLIGVMGFYVIYPLVLILINSFNTATIAEPPVYGLQAWRDAFSEPGIWRSLWNSIRVGVTLQIVALPIGICISWLLARTNIYAAGRSEEHTSELQSTYVISYAVFC